jgi:ankyrin repeat protein
MKKYIEAGAEVKDYMPHRFICEGQTEIVRLLLESGAIDVNEVHDYRVHNRDGELYGDQCSYLFAAIEHDRVDIVRLFVSHGADMNGRYRYEKDYYDMFTGDDDVYIFPPLHCAIYYKCSVEMLQTLLDLGADPNEYVNNYTPMQIALKKGNKLAVDFLLKVGVDMNNGISTNYYRAIESNNYDVFSAVVENTHTSNVPMTEDYSYLYDGEYHNPIDMLLYHIFRSHARYYERGDKNHFKMLCLLIRNTKEVNRITDTSTYMTILHTLCSWFTLKYGAQYLEESDVLSLIKDMVEKRRANVLLADSAEKLASDYAKENGMLQIYTYLKGVEDHLLKRG